VNDREKELRERRAHNDHLRATIFAGAKFSGPWVEVFFEGWVKVGFHSNMGHYWRRRPEDRVLSTCGVWKDLEYTIRGQVMIFEVGNFPKCAKCALKRQRA
jgi:hypothetical protein